jgi:hypothetical protein
VTLPWTVTGYDGRPGARPGAGAEVTILGRMVPAMRLMDPFADARPPPDAALRNDRSIAEHPAGRSPADQATGATRRLTLMPNSGRCVNVYLCAEPHAAGGSEDRRIYLVGLISGSRRILARSLWPTWRSTALPDIRIWALWCIVAGSPIGGGMWCLLDLPGMLGISLAGRGHSRCRVTSGLPFPARLSVELRMSGWRDSPCRSGS